MSTLIAFGVICCIIVGVTAGQPVNITLTPNSPFNISLVMPNTSGWSNRICSLQFIDPLVSDWLLLDGLNCCLVGKAPPISLPNLPITSAPLQISVLYTLPTATWQYMQLLVFPQWLNQSAAVSESPVLNRPLSDQFIPLIRLNNPLLATSWSFRFTPDTFVTSTTKQALPGSDNSGGVEYRLLHAAAGKRLPDWLQFSAHYRLLSIPDLSVVDSGNIQQALSDGQLVRLRELQSAQNRLVLPLILVAKNLISTEFAYSQFYLSLLTNEPDRSSSSNSNSELSLFWQQKLKRIELPPPTAFSFSVGEEISIPLRFVSGASLNLSVQAVRYDGDSANEDNWLRWDGSGQLMGGRALSKHVGRWNLTLLLSDSQNFGFRFPLVAANNETQTFAGDGSLALPLPALVISNLNSAIINQTHLLNELGGRLADPLLSRVKIGAVLPPVNVGSSQNATIFKFSVPIAGLFTGDPSVLAVSGLLGEPLPPWLTFNTIKQQQIDFGGVWLQQQSPPQPSAAAYFNASHSLMIRLSPQTGGLMDDVVLTLLINGRPLPRPLPSPEQSIITVQPEEPFNWTVPRVFDDETVQLTLDLFHSSVQDDTVRFNSTSGILSGKLSAAGNYTALFVGKELTGAYSVWPLQIVCAQLPTLPRPPVLISLTGLLILLACLVLFVATVTLLIGYFRFSRMRREDWKRRFGSLLDDEEDGLVWEYARYLASCACCRLRRRLQRTTPVENNMRENEKGKRGRQRRFSFSSFKLDSGDRRSSSSASGETLQSSVSRQTMADGNDDVQMFSIDGDRLKRQPSSNGVYLRSLKDGSITAFAEAGKAFHFAYPMERLTSRLDALNIPATIADAPSSTDYHAATATAAESVLNGLSYISYPSTGAQAAATNQLPANFHRVKLSTKPLHPPASSEDGVSIAGTSEGSTSAAGGLINGQPVIFSARLVPSGHELPSWLHFNRKKCTFFGIPLIFDCGSWDIELTCTIDGVDSLSVSERLRLEVMEELL